MEKAQPGSAGSWGTTRDHCLLDCFKISDHRQRGKVLYPLEEVMLLCLLGYWAERRHLSTSPGSARRRSALLHYLLAMASEPTGVAIRGHRAVEHSLHWVMDMIFRHDQCRVHIGHAPATYLKHMVHIVIRKGTSPDFYGSLLISIDDVPTSWYVTVMSIARAQHESKAKILDAALRVIRTKGYSATTIDDICLSAGLTKGSFFHHFKSKEELALAAAAHFAAVTDDLFATAPYRSLPDPRDRVIGYVSFRKAILNRALPEFTCLLGTMVQETYETHPAIRKVCDKHISAHAAAIERDITEAKRICAPEAEWSAQGLALFTQAVIQGAFVLAKAKHGPEIAIECLDHLQWYLETQFTPTTK